MSDRSGEFRQVGNAVLRVLSRSLLFLGSFGLVLTIPFLATDVTQALVVLTCSILFLSIGFELRRHSRPIALPAWIRSLLHAAGRALLFLGTAGVDFPDDRPGRDSESNPDR